MRKTKIICTIGPASESEKVFRQLCEAGLNVARLNFSHGTHEEHQKKIDMIKKVRAELGLPIAIMLDTKGPEYRVGEFKDGKAEVVEGEKFTFTTDDIIGDNTKCSVSYKNLMKDLKVGDTILVNNGLLDFVVDEIKGNDAICTVRSGGTISNRKSMNFPDHILKNEFLSEQDKADLLFGIKNDVDFVAASFVSTKQNMVDMRKFLNDNGGKDIDIIAKIENRTGVNNIEEICEVADGIMVARGDLGVEVPFMELPSLQKHLIYKCRMLGKRVITATEMLESMIHNPRPTRAEASDVANAVYDGTSAVMLSGESAAGKYPVQAVKSMSEICEYAEKSIDYKQWFSVTEYDIRNSLDAVSHATCSMAIDLNAKAIVVSSISGITVRMVSRFRCPVDILGMTVGEKAWRKLNLSWGVTPIRADEFTSLDVMFYFAVQNAKKTFGLKSGDNIVLTGGSTGKGASTDTIRVEKV